MIIVAWGGARGRTGRLFGAARSRNGGLRSWTVAFFLRFIAVIPMVNHRRSRQKKEAIKLDHPQTSASIRNTEGEGWCFGYP